MIDIIIPAYNSHDYIDNLLCSIIMQTMKDDITVYIIDDCSIKGYKEIIDRYKDILKIKEIRLDVNSGPGVARQVGIDNSKSKYIVFIDSDDILDNCYSIETLYNNINDNNMNVVSSYFTEEIDNGTIDHKDNMIWPHGKIYRRSFLEQNNIRFNDTRANEDTGFNKLIYLLTDDILYIKDFTYIWKDNLDSITRSTDYNFYGIEGYIYNICWAIDEGIKRDADKSKISKVLFETMLEIYHRYIIYSDREEVGLILKWAKKLKQYYQKYCDSLKDEDKYNVTVTNTESLIGIIGADKFLNNSITFDSFIELI